MDLLQVQATHALARRQLDGARHPRSGGVVDGHGWSLQPGVHLSRVNSAREPRSTPFSSPITNRACELGGRWRTRVAPDPMIVASYMTSMRTVRPREQSVTESDRTSMAKHGLSVQRLSASDWYSAGVSGR